MSDLITCIGVSVALFSVCIAGCTFIIGDKISDLSHEIRELRRKDERKER